MDHRIHRTADGVGLEVAGAGSGDTTFLVIPGFGAGIEPYAAFIDALAAEHRVLGLSVRGFGRSEWAAPYAVSDWVGDVVDVASSVAETPLIPIGHSFGAMIALGAAARAPGRFETVVSLDQIIDLAALVPVVGRVNGYWQQVRQAVAGAFGDPAAIERALADVVGADGRLVDTTPPGELRRMADKWSTQDPSVLEALTDDRYESWIGDADLLELPTRVGCPVVSILGDPLAGSIVGAELAEANAAAFPGLLQVRISDVGHRLGLDENPARVVDAIRDAMSALH